MIKIVRTTDKINKKINTPVKNRPGNLRTRILFKNVYFMLFCLFVCLFIFQCFRFSFNIDQLSLCQLIFILDHHCQIIDVPSASVTSFLKHIEDFYIRIVISLFLGENCDISTDAGIAA